MRKNTVATRKSFSGHEREVCGINLEWHWHFLSRV